MAKAGAAHGYYLMQIITHQTPARAQPRPYNPYPVQAAQRAAAPARTIEQEGLSQAELRKIVIDLIG